MIGKSESIIPKNCKMFLDFHQQGIF